MQWLNDIVDEAVRRRPEGEIIVSSGVSPSGVYHLGTLREVMTAEAIAAELIRRGRKARHLHIVDDLDVLRKVPAGISADFEKQLGKPLCDVPSPDGKAASYADYFLNDLVLAAKELKLKMVIVRSHEKYRAGFFVPAIEKTLESLDQIKKILIQVSGRSLDEQWSPVQVIEDGYLKTRQFVSLDKAAQTLEYQDNEGKKNSIGYAKGDVKLNWRIDWPARWWLLKVDVEPFGRDHATKGGSYDTGAAIARKVFGIEPPLPLPYAFINRTGETKKMSKSAGDTITAAELMKILPPEAVWYFLLRYAPDKQLFFDSGPTLIRLFDEFAELLSKPKKTADDEQLIELCTGSVAKLTISTIPFSHLVASYQAALKDPELTLEIIGRSEYSSAAKEEAETIKRELKFIDRWLEAYAPTEAKFELSEAVDSGAFTDVQKDYLNKLADKITTAPKTADGEWFHKAIYGLAEEVGVVPKDLFMALYKALIGQSSGPRAGWFLSILPREWLISRLRLEG